VPQDKAAPRPNSVDFTEINVKQKLFLQHAANIKNFCTAVSNTLGENVGDKVLSKERGEPHERFENLLLVAYTKDLLHYSVQHAAAYKRLQTRLNRTAVPGISAEIYTQAQLTFTFIGASLLPCLVKEQQTLGSLLPTCASLHRCLPLPLTQAASRHPSTMPTLLRSVTSAPK